MKWKDLYKIGVSGSRRYDGLYRVGIYFERYIRKKCPNLDNLVVITGGALGVDSMIEGICMRLGIKNLIIPAKWLELERAAGPIRNKVIVSMSNEILAFWNGDAETSPGTKQCIEYAKSVGKPVKVIKPPKLVRLTADVMAPTPVIKLPPKTTGRQAHRVRDWVAGADLANFLKEDKPKKKKRKFKWQKEDKYVI